MSSKLKSLGAALRERKARTHKGATKDRAATTVEEDVQVAEIRPSLFLSGLGGATNGNPTTNLLLREGTPDAPLGIRAVVIAASKLSVPEKYYASSNNTPQEITVAGHVIRVQAKPIVVPELPVRERDPTAEEVAGHRELWMAVVAEAQSALLHQLQAAVSEESGVGIVEVPIFYFQFDLDDNTNGRLCRVWPTVIDVVDFFSGRTTGGQENVEKSMSMLGATLSTGDASSVRVAPLNLKTSVLVHCMLGRSRSASLVAAYLLVRDGLTVADAMAKITTSRPVADPNVTFRVELLKLQRSLDL